MTGTGTGTGIGTGPAKLTVLIVDDHPTFRRGLRSMLENTDWAGQILEAEGVEDAVRTATIDRPDVVAMDLTLPDGTGLEATTRILKARPDAAILALTMTNDPELVSTLLAAGARGYLLKESDPDSIVDALHAITRGAIVLGPHIDLASLNVGGTSPRRRRPSPLDPLTDREREVLAQLGTGHTNAQIGRAIGLSEKTVRNHLSAIYAKLHVSDRTQAALLAREAGLES